MVLSAYNNGGMGSATAVSAVVFSAYSSGGMGSAGGVGSGRPFVMALRMSAGIALAQYESLRVLR